MVATAESQPAYIFVDDIPPYAVARQEVRTHALALVDSRQQQLAAGDLQAVPLEIDALSTAEKILEYGEQFGNDSYEYQTTLNGLQLDCRRLVAEWYRKKRPEYFAPSRHFFDAETGDFYSHGLSVRQMTENALRPIAGDPEEVARRVNERVEDATAHIVKKLGGFTLAQTGIRTISECTDKAISDYQEDIKNKTPHRGYSGYVPEIEKVMIRDMRFDETSGDRFEEQIGLPGIYINHYVIQNALNRRGVNAHHMNKTELHGAQLLVEDDLIDFVQLLDEVASEEWCTNIFMGEEVDHDFVKDYSRIRAEAEHRQEGLRGIADTVAVFIMDLAADKGFDRRKAPAHVEEFVKKLLLGEAKKDASVADQIFDKATAQGLEEVVRLEAIGRHDLAFIRMQEVEKAAPGGGYCQGGSCGLESVDVLSEEGKQLAKELKAESSDTIVKDKERACKCGKKDIVYAYSSNKVNKFCTSCKAFESKVTSGKK